jgi:uncharacterized protein YbjT (DUF2867 family)
MKIFIAGATGVVGRRLIPELVVRGDEVAATTQSATKAAALEALGAQSVVVDLLDRDAAVHAVREAKGRLSSTRMLNRRLIGSNARTTNGLLQGVMC